MKGLLNKLYQEGVIKSEKVFNALLQTDRGDFTNPTNAYLDR